MTKLLARNAVRVGLAATIGIAGAFIAVQPAQALPDHCEKPLIVANWARGHCYSDDGKGQWQLFSTCVDYTGATYKIHTPWTKNNQYAYANCNAGATPRTYEGSTGWSYKKKFP